MVASLWGQAGRGRGEDPQPSPWSRGLPARVSRCGPIRDRIQRGGQKKGEFSGGERRAAGAVQRGGLGVEPEITRSSAQRRLSIGRVRAPALYKESSGTADGGGRARLR